MESPEDIEKALFRLMPAAFSEDGKRSLDELIDGLAAGETLAESPGKSAWPWLGGIGAAAAAAALAFALNLPAGSPAATDVAATPPPPANAGGVVLLQQSERVENAQPESWMSETDGVAHRAWTIRVIDEARLRDLETGYEVLVSRPREEVILMPVNAF